MAKKRIVILVEKLYEDLELWYPKILFEALGADVEVVGPKKGTYQGKNGYPVEAHVAARDVGADDLDALIIPGGFAPDYLRRSRDALKLIKAAHEAGKPVAAICHAGWTLISAGLAKGRKLTGYSAIKDDLVNAGATYVDEPVVVDGNLITSRRPADLPWFCKAVAQALGLPASV
jgi:protease I